MHSPILLAAVLCVIVWLYLLLTRGGFWMVGRLGASVPQNIAPGRIAVVIPARNEADVIGQSVSSLMAQSCVDAMHIFVIDDNSTDGTAEAAGAAARKCSRPEALTVIPGQALPPGWTGKLWAVQQGIDKALPTQPQFLLLTDADIYHSPQNVSTLATLAEIGGYGLTSFMVKLHCQSFAEKLLIPAFVFFFFMLYPPEWIRSSRHKTAGAAGGCMLIRPAALERAGGISAIRQEIIDDCVLAAAVKRSGGKVWLGVTPDTVSLRNYGSFAEIERMIARAAFNQLRHSAWLLVCALLGLALVYLLPVALLFSGAGLLLVAGVLAYSLMFATYLPMVRFYGLNALWALTMPLGAVFYMMATLRSAVKYWSGRGGDWKGRTQDLRKSE